MRTNRILVWDAPTRVFHWLLVLCFAGAWLSSESDRWQQWHIAFGYTAGGSVTSGTNTRANPYVCQCPHQ